MSPPRVFEVKDRFHSSVINEDRLYYRSLNQIFLPQLLKDVEIGVVRARTIVKWILNKLEPGDTDVIERLVICACEAPYCAGDLTERRVSHCSTIPIDTV